MSDLTPIEAIAAVAGNHEIASIAISDAERATGAMTLSRLETAKNLFATHGYIRVQNLFTAEQMAAFDAQYRDRYRNFLTATNKHDKRPLFTVDIEGAFAQEHVMSNPIIVPFFEHFLEKILFWPQ